MFIALAPDYIICDQFKWLMQNFELILGNYSQNSFSRKKMGRNFFRCHFCGTLRFGACYGKNYRV